MKKIYFLLGTVFFVCCLFNAAFAQAPASAKWELTNPAATGGGTGLTVATTGQIEAEEERLNNMAVGGYTGPQSSQRLQIVRQGTGTVTSGNAWPANQTDTLSKVYVQFAVRPTTGQDLRVTNLSYKLAAAGSGSMRARIYYSTDPNFATATLLENGTGRPNDAVVRDTLIAVSGAVNVEVKSGQTFFLRFYPWMHAQSAQSTGKYITPNNVVITGTTSPASGVAIPKKVAYVMSNKTMDANTADPIIAMLQADPQINLTVHAVAGDATVDLAGYDVVVVQEGFNSGDAIYKPTGSLALSKITVPFLYNKTYALRNGRAVVAGGGTSADVGDTAITVSAANRSNELFKGITFTNGAFPIFKTRATDTGGSGATATKTVNYTHGLTISANNTLLGTVPAIDAIEDKNKVVFLNDIPAGTTIGDQVTKARMIAVGLNTGAIMKDNGTNMTREGLTLMRNAIYSLAGLPIPNTAVVTSLAAETRNSSFNLSQNYPNPFDGSTTIAFELKKSSYVTLEVYDITGKRVALLANGAKAAGVHEVKLETSLKNGIYFYRLNANGATATRKMVVTR